MWGRPLYRGVIGIATGNDAASQIIRRRIPPHESIAEAGQEIARIEPAIPQGAARILDEFVGQAALKRSIALSDRSLWELTGFSP